MRQTWLPTCTRCGEDRARFASCVVLAAVAIVAVSAGALFVYSGMYNVAATRPHIEPVQWLLETVMRQSVRRHAQAIACRRSAIARSSRVGARCTTSIAYDATARPASLRTRLRSA